MALSRIEFLSLPGIPLVQAGDDPAVLIGDALAAAELTLVEGDVVIVAQKLISKAEGRTRRLSEITASPQAVELAAATAKEPAMVQAILDESKEILRHRPGVLIARHKLGVVLANAGIDRSNVGNDPDVILLLPVDPDGAAQQLRTVLQKHFNCALGVIIVDSVGRAWRMGTTGLALGSAGVEALENLRGHTDLFGRTLQVSEHAVADSLASAAQLVMGEADEATPVVIARGLRQGHSRQQAAALLRPERDDMFR